MGAPTQVELARDPGVVWRIGFRPDPWAWSDWKYATDDGRFTGRWDDIAGQFRTVYAGESLTACLLEVLAKYRRDPVLAGDLDQIAEDAADVAQYPARAAGVVSYHWLEDRVASSAPLTGAYCLITSSTSLSVLWPKFIAHARQLGLADLDASALKDSAPRDLTRSIASWLYSESSPQIDGVQFSSRHGDDLKLWAVFERPEDLERSPRLSEVTVDVVTPETPALLDAFWLLDLAWVD